MHFTHFAVFLVMSLNVDCAIWNLDKHCPEKSKSQNSETGTVSRRVIRPKYSNIPKRTNWDNILKYNFLETYIVARRNHWLGNSTQINVLISTHLGILLLQSNQISRYQCSRLCVCVQRGASNMSVKLYFSRLSLSILGTSVLRLFRKSSHFVSVNTFFPGPLIGHLLEQSTKISVPVD